MDKRLNHILCNLLVILCFVFWESEGLANSAVYTVKNEGTKQCLSAGPLKKSHNAKLELFKQGTALSKPCSNMSTLATTDFGQQWTIRIKNEEPTKQVYHVQMAMVNTQYEDPGFHARLRGEFISYFPKLIKLKQGKTKNPNEFLIVDPTTGYCLTDSDSHSNSNQVKFSKCVNPNGKRRDHDIENGWNKTAGDFQLWNFAMVNEIQIAKEREHRKLSKGSAYQWTDEYYWKGNITRKVTHKLL